MVESVLPSPAIAPLLSLAGANRCQNILRRRILRTFPFSHLRSSSYRKRLAAFSPPGDLALQEEIYLLHTAGALTLQRDRTSLLFGTDLMPLCDQARAVLFRSPYPVIENDMVLAACPDFYRLGLNPAILDLVEAYLGLDCLYLGATLKRERADDRVSGTRQWHLDVEDERLLRILLYLAPVAPDGGAFEFFPTAISRQIKTALHYHSGYVSHTRMSSVAQMALVQQCPGDAGDAVIFDGANVFHRGGAPRGQDRYSITFTYCSRAPLELRASARLPHTIHRHFLATLSARQRCTIPPPRSF